MKWFYSLLLLSLPGGCAGVQCWVTGGVTMDFGYVSYRTPTDVWSSVGYACQIPWDASGATYHLRMCHFIDADPTLSGIAPRSLKHWNGTLMHYDLYHDAARTQLIGPAGSVWPMGSWVRDAAMNTQMKDTMMLYGRVPAGQGELSNGVYESHYNGGHIRWRWSSGINSTPSADDCRNNTGGDGGGEISYFLNVQASAREACVIRMITAINFGTSPHMLTSPVDALGRVDISCPSSVKWSLTMDNGLHAQQGSRNMMNSRGDSLTYGLYQDAARTQPWGSGAGLSGTGLGVSKIISEPVYGRIPVQQVNSSGEYTDTVTITLSY